nr:LOW QUALITY PROTEIN: extensin-like [Microcebus murinus]
MPLPCPTPLFLLSCPKTLFLLSCPTPLFLLSCPTPLFLLSCPTPLFPLLPPPLFPARLSSTTSLPNCPHKVLSPSLPPTPAPLSYTFPLPPPKPNTPHLVPISSLPPLPPPLPLPPATPEAPPIFDVSAAPISLLPFPRKTPERRKRSGRFSVPPTVRLCWGVPRSSSPHAVTLVYFCPQLLSPPETSRDPRSPPPLPPRLREIPQPEQHRGPERGVPAPRAPCHPPWLSPGHPPRSPYPALHPLALPSPLWGDSGVTRKKVKGAGGGGVGNGFFFYKKKSKSIICKRDDDASRHPRAPHPPTPGAPGWRERGQSPSPQLFPPPPKKKKPSQVSMSHRTPPSHRLSVNKSKLCQLHLGAPPPTLCMPPILDPLLQLHVSNKPPGAARSSLREGAPWEGGWPLEGGPAGLLPFIPGGQPTILSRENKNFELRWGRGDRFPRPQPGVGFGGHETCTRNS